MAGWLRPVAAVPAWVLLLATGSAGGTLLGAAVAVYFSVFLVNPLLIIAVGVVGGVLVGLLVAGGAIAGRSVGTLLDRPAAGAMLAALAVTAVIVSVTSAGWRAMDPISIAIAAGGALAALVFFVEVRWHRAANETPVAA